METEMTPSRFFMEIMMRFMVFIAGIGVVLSLMAMLVGDIFEGDAIAYIGSRNNTVWSDGKFAVNVYDVRTRLVVPLTAPSLYPQIYNWSHDGTYIAFVARPYGGVENPSALYVMRADGAETRRISGDLVVIITSERPPYWTADNQSLIFQAQQMGVNNVQFFRGRLDGQPPELLDLNDARAQGYLQNLFPSFQVAPNGIYQAQVDYRDNGWGLFVVLRGIRQKIYPLTAEQMTPDDPDWSPDSTRIAFSQREGGVPMIWVLSLTGERIFRIEQGRYPLWKP
jgi:Tol biopolymer transport system component